MTGIRVAAVWTATALAALTLSTAPSKSEDIRVFTSGAPAEVEKVLARAFTDATDHRVLLTVGNLSAIRDRLTGAEAPDLVVLPTPAIDTLDKAGKLRAGTRRDLARVGIGVAVRQGAPLPDLSTVDAVRTMLLEARSIVHPDPQGGGFTGAYIARMIARLGIADAVKPKLKVMFAIGGGVAAVAVGDAEIGLFNISEILPVPGVTMAGPLPAALQNYIAFAGALGPNASEPASAFLRFVASPGANEAWRAGGFEPLVGSP